MFDLVVQVTSEPVVEGAPGDVTCRDRLSHRPVVFLISIYLHGNVVTLCDKQKPVTLKESEIKEPSIIISAQQCVKVTSDHVYSLCHCYNALRYNADPVITLTERNEGKTRSMRATEIMAIMG